MNDDKRLTIHFNNGSDMKITFPTQIKNSPGALVETVKTILGSDKLVIQTQEQLRIIPWGSVKFAEITSLPSTALPFGAIKGAKIISDDK